jgi:hypothetical protein
MDANIEMKIDQEIKQYLPNWKINIKYCTTDEFMQRLKTMMAHYGKQFTEIECRTITEELEIYKNTTIQIETILDAKIIIEPSIPKIEDRSPEIIPVTINKENEPISVDDKLRIYLNEKFDQFKPNWEFYLSQYGVLSFLNQYIYFLGKSGKTLTDNEFNTLKKKLEKFKNNLVLST